MNGRAMGVSRRKCPRGFLSESITALESNVSIRAEWYVVAKNQKWELASIARIG